VTVLRSGLATACKVTPVDPEETFEDIRQAAQEAGYEITPTQLRRWHRAGLLGTPRQQALGRGRGTVTRYPPGTAARVLGICRVLTAHRSLRDVAWTLWWEGDDLADGIAREQLEDSAQSLRADFEKFVDADGLTQAAEEFLDTANDARLPSRPLRWARRRLGTDSFDTFLDSLLSVMAGRTDRLDDSDISLLDRGLGFESGRTDLLATGEPWLTGDARSDFVAIGQLFGPDRVDEGLRIDDAELRPARDEAKDFLTVVGAMGRIVSAGFGRWGYGLGMIGAAMDEFAEGPEGQRRFFLLWLSMRTSEFREGMQSIAANAAKMAEAGAPLEAVKDLLASVPAVGREISVRDVVRARFDSAKQAELQETVQRVRAVHGEEIDRFFENRGQIA